MQGPHQVAQKSRTTTLPLSEASASLPPDRRRQLQQRHGARRRATTAGATGEEKSSGQDGHRQASHGGIIAAGPDRLFLATARPGTGFPARQARGHDSGSASAGTRFWLGKRGDTIPARQAHRVPDLLICRSAADRPVRKSRRRPVGKGRAGARGSDERTPGSRSAGAERPRAEALPAHGPAAALLLPWPLSPIREARGHDSGSASTGTRFWLGKHGDTILRSASCPRSADLLICRSAADRPVRRAAAGPWGRGEPERGARTSEHTAWIALGRSGAPPRGGSPCTRASSSPVVAVAVGIGPGRPGTRFWLGKPGAPFRPGKRIVSPLLEQQPCCCPGPVREGRGHDKRIASPIHRRAPAAGCRRHGGRSWPAPATGRRASPAPRQP